MNIEKIEKHIEKLPSIQTNEKKNQNVNEVKISVVQRTIKPVKDIESYIDMLYGFIWEASNKNSQLVVFPEYNFFDLFGFVPGFTLLNRFLKAKEKKNKKDPKDTKESIDFSKALKVTAPYIEEGIKIIFSALARKSQMYLYSGTYLVVEGDDLKNKGYLYAPTGKLIGSQGKLHLTDFEEELGIVREKTLKAFDLPIGKIALPICMDASYFETFYQARELRVDLALLPIANMEKYHLEKAMRGVWTRTQESYIYGAKASLNGWIAGMHFTGKAGIFAPLSLTPKKDGIVALSDSSEGDELITAKIDYKKLKQEREEAQYFGDRNSHFEKNYIEKTYINKEKGSLLI